MAKAPIFIYNSAMRGFATGALGCQIFAFMGAYSGIGAGMTNACIAYDRYSSCFITLFNDHENLINYGKTNIA